MLLGLICPGRSYNQMDAPKQLAVVHDYDELIAAIRARRDELEVTHATLDHVSGLASGHTSKLFCIPPIKRLGMISLGAMLGSVGLMLVVVEDPAALARVSGRLVKRERPARSGRAIGPANSDGLEKRGVQLGKMREHFDAA
jgi:hypothetical protein